MGFSHRNMQLTIDTTLKTYKKDGILYVCGNGGSAEQSNHFVGELVPIGYRAVSLACNTATLTAIANDFGYENIFSHQLRTMGRNGDILYALSTSGNSKNVLKAVEEAKRLGIATVGLTSKSGGSLIGMVDIKLDSPTDDTQECQRYHLDYIHEIYQFLKSIKEGR